MLDLSITMLDIESTLVGFYDSAISCIVSDDNAAQLVCRINLALDTASTDLLTDIKALEQSLIDGLVIKGIRGIEKAIQEKPGALKKLESMTHAFVTDDAWSITTAGSNLLEVMAHPCVDFTKTITNDVYEVYQTLGIEAARAVLLDQIDEVQDRKLNFRHLSLLVDVMTNRGAFMSIDRHGINNRGELGPLAKCSFEQTTDMLIKAGIFAERDALNGVSANTMLGQVAPCGTGDCSVRIDFKRLAEIAKPVALRSKELMSIDEAEEEDSYAPPPMMDLSTTSASASADQPRYAADAIQIV
jgi:DNA-directed RNA polymerase II subunit RPB1